MLVYRVEHKDNRNGPFSGRNYAGEFMKDHRTPLEIDHSDETYSFLDNSCRFGAVSMLALDSTFVEDWRGLLGRGFIVSVYETNEYRVLKDGQVMFFPGQLLKELTTMTDVMCAIEAEME